MDLWMIFVQFLGIVAMLISFISFQCRTNKNYLLMQGIGMVLFTVHFLLLGSMGGALMNLIGAVRSRVFFHKRNRDRLWMLFLFIFITVAAIGVCVIFFKENFWLSLLIFTANTANTWSLWKGDGRIMRIVVLTVQAPLWIVYNVFAFSIAGIITEVINMASSGVALYRYRKIGFK